MWIDDKDFGNIKVMKSITNEFIIQILSYVLIEIWLYAFKIVLELLIKAAIFIALGYFVLVIAQVFW